MSLFKLALKPGIDKQNTEYGAEGGWTDCDNVRFRYALPEKIGGWRPFEDTKTHLVGLVTDMLSWADLNGVPYVIAGTNRKLYVVTGGLWVDITPIRSTSNAGDVTFEAEEGAVTLTVTHTSHGAIRGDFVTFSGAVSLGGAVPADQLNSEYEITEVLDDDTYVITMTGAAEANASDTGDGGAAVVAEYQINVGSDISYYDFGWGVCSWNELTWGTPRLGCGEGIFLLGRIWQFDNYGEDVICQLIEGATYYWDASQGLQNNRATRLAGSPSKSNYALVSTPDRHLVCFGTETTVGDSTTHDPMFVRFSDQENISNFVEEATNTAGGQRLTDGSKIITCVRSRGQTLILTETSLHGMQYVGPPYTFGFTQLGANCGCLGRHAAVDVNGLAFWMGVDSFWTFDGTVKKIPCTVEDYVFKDFNPTQGSRIFGALNSKYNEVIWFYCSADSNYTNRCVTYNYLENTWAVGSLDRDAWEDVGIRRDPIGSKYDKESEEATISTIYGLTPGRSVVFDHETGTEADGQPMVSYLESAYFDIQDGEQMMFVKRFIPDFKYQSGSIAVNLFVRAYPQTDAVAGSLDPYVITPSTTKVDTRARGRQVALKITSSEAGADWRFGTLRIDAQPDGLR